MFVANDAFCKGELNVQLQHETQLVLYFGKTCLERSNLQNGGPFGWQQRATESR
jgi:hypothetical protein